MSNNKFQICSNILGINNHFQIFSNMTKYHGLTNKWATMGLNIEVAILYVLMDTFSSFTGKWERYPIYLSNKYIIYIFNQNK